MNKYELDHLKTRIENIVKCVNGIITTYFEKQKVTYELIDKEKYEMICDGRAVLKRYLEIKDISSYNKTALSILFKCFNFPKNSPEQEKIIKSNEKIDERKNDLIHEVELEGKRIIDNIVLKLIKPKDIPNELHKLSSMANIIISKPTKKK